MVFFVIEENPHVLKSLAGFKTAAEAAPQPKATVPSRGGGVDMFSMRMRMTPHEFFLSRIFWSWKTTTPNHKLSHQVGRHGHPIPASRKTSHANLLPCQSSGPIPGAAEASATSSEVGVELQHLGNPEENLWGCLFARHVLLQQAHQLFQSCNLKHGIQMIDCWKGLKVYETFEG